MSEAKTYDGSCHCGKVTYKVTVGLEGAMSCNCSICGRTGSVLAFAPAETFELLSGKDDLKDYQFNKNVIHHLFCTTCGVRSFARGVGPGGKEMVAVNVRCLEGVDLDTLDVKKVDGKKL